MLMSLSDNSEPILPGREHITISEENFLQKLTMVCAGSVLTASGLLQTLSEQGFSSILASGSVA